MNHLAVTGFSSMPHQGSSAVADSDMENSQPFFPLLSLPEPTFLLVVKSLRKEDIRCLVGVCRKLAASVSALSPNSQVKVTPSTDWKKLFKVLKTRTIPCNTMCIASKKDITIPFRQHAETTVGFLLKPGNLGSSLPGIRKLCINVLLLPCILPTRLASLLPDLEEVDVNCESTPDIGEADLHEAALQPIAHNCCVRKIRCSGTTLQLPSKYHTSEDLRTQLPNVMSLEICLLRSFLAVDWEILHSFIQTLVDAWSGKLTKLVVNTGQSIKLLEYENLSKSMEPVQLQHCTCLQSLDWSVDVKIPFPTFLPPSLTAIKLGVITESHLEIILQLPLVREFSFVSFHGGLQHDWSKHTCSWKELHVHSLNIVHLAQLPLKSMWGKGCLTIQCLKLPDPSDSSSFSNVQHAVECVQYARATIEGLRDWHVKLTRNQEGDRSYAEGTELAGMIQTAAEVVQPCESYQISFHTARYSQTTAALLDWLSPELCNLQVPHISDASPQLWASLHHCKKLVRVMFSCSLGSDQYSADITALVMQASELYVAVTGRPITLVLEGMAKELNTMKEAIGILMSELQGQLPTSVTMSGFSWEPHGYREHLVIRLYPTCIVANT